MCGGEFGRGVMKRVMWCVGYVVGVIVGLLIDVVDWFRR